MKFKEFILNEEAKAKHALRFFEYEQQEHTDLVRKLRADLVTAWEKIAKKYPPVDVQEETSTKAPLASVNVKAAEELIGRFGTKFHVAPSVLVGTAYDRHVRNECKKALLEAGYALLEKYMKKMNNSEAGDPFIITRDDGPLSDIRLKFKTGDYAKTVFVIGTEPGYKFERVYLREALQK
jgi:hypothetical protein